MAFFDSTALLAQIRDDARLPTSSVSAPGFQDADLLRRANKQLLAVLTPQLISAKSEYLTQDKDYTLVAGTAGYAMPTRAVMGKVREVALIASDGKTLANLQEKRLEDLNGLDPTIRGTPTHYYFKRNTLLLYPTPDAALTMRVTLFRRPNRLVAATTGTSGNIGIVLSATATVVTFTTSRPSAFTTSTPLDFIQASPPFDALADDKTPTAVGGSTVTFAAGVIPSGLAAGDFVCLAEESPILQLPAEMFYLLAQRVASSLAPGGEEERETMTDELLSTVEQRNDGEPEYLVNRDWA